MRVSPHRLLAAFVLIAWMAPAAGALGIALHVALEHGTQGTEHPQESSEVAHGLADSHHHDLEAATGEEHEARVDRLSPALRSPASVVASLPSAASVAAPSIDWVGHHSTAHHAPPDPLFTTHCSLLL